MRTLVVAALMVVSMSAAAHAERRAAIYAGQAHVVHSRRAPVVLHRAVPPFKGVHVYQGRR
jgi:hypothetical protein